MRNDDNKINRFLFSKLFKHEQEFDELMPQPSTHVLITCLENNSAITILNYLIRLARFFNSKYGTLFTRFYSISRKLMSVHRHSQVFHKMREFFNNFDLLSEENSN